jgi:hypothetical protein
MSERPILTLLAAMSKGSWSRPGKACRYGAKNAREVRDTSTLSPAGTRENFLSRLPDDVEKLFLHPRAKKGK